MSDITAQIDEANQQAIQIMMAGQPVWIGCKPALEVIPGMTKNTVLHAGPPISWEEMCIPMRNGVLGAVVYEGLANNIDEAQSLVDGGEILLAPCHSYSSVGGMTGITSASMPVHVVHNRKYDTYAYCAPHEGSSPKGFGWGTNDEETIQHAHWLEDELGPVLDAALEACGGIDLREIIGRSIQMGDELHSRCVAATGHITRQLAPHIINLDLPTSMRSRVLEFMLDSDIFALHVVMAAGRSIIEPAKGVPYSSVVTTMARNGVEFGIKVSGLGDTWFTGPAQPIESIFFSPEWNAEVAAPDIGDSSIVETIGLGGMIHAASPSYANALNNNFADALAKTEDAYAMCVSEHNSWMIPYLDFKGIPFGIDVRKVLQLGITPILDTATVHVNGGKIGIGEARAPFEAFELALKALAIEWEVTM
ncbi:MAG: DUF1116 domain-containing protein [Anaerolineales bacterium]|nr:MAG: DUF1116 domain-containing protein [Anaerolineales bacterium]